LPALNTELLSKLTKIKFWIFRTDSKKKFILYPSFSPHPKKEKSTMLNRSKNQKYYKKSWESIVKIAERLVLQGQKYLMRNKKKLRLKFG